MVCICFTSSPLEPYLDNASTLSVNEGAKVVGINGILVADETDSEKVELNKNASNVNVNGYVWGSNVGITINGNITSITECPTITIGSNAEIVTDGDETVGLYLAGYGKTTIADGAKMSGTASAIEIRAGELTVNGGTFTSTADNFSITPNWNGSTTVWAALSSVFVSCVIRSLTKELSYELRTDFVTSSLFFESIVTSLEPGAIIGSDWLGSVPTVESSVIFTAI